MGKLRTDLPLGNQQPEKNYTQLFECIQDYMHFKVGDQIYYNLTMIEKYDLDQYWKLAGRENCRKLNLDSWATGIVRFSAQAHKYLLQANQDIYYGGVVTFNKGDRIWWHYAADNMVSANDKDKWTTVRKYDEAKDGVKESVGQI